LSTKKEKKSFLSPQDQSVGGRGPAEHACNEHLRQVAAVPSRRWKETEGEKKGEARERGGGGNLSAAAKDELLNKFLEPHKRHPCDKTSEGSGAPKSRQKRLVIKYIAIPTSENDHPRKNTYGGGNRTSFQLVKRVKGNRSIRTNSNICGGKFPVGSWSHNARKKAPRKENLNGATLWVDQ